MTETTAVQASPEGMSSSSDGNAWISSVAPVETQLGVEGHEASRPPVTPRFVGRSPEHAAAAVAARSPDRTRPTTGVTGPRSFPCDAVQRFAYVSASWLPAKKKTTGTPPGRPLPNRAQQLEWGAYHRSPEDNNAYVTQRAQVRVARFRLNGRSLPGTYRPNGPQDRSCHRASGGVTAGGLQIADY
jgi:hypothetical protein